MVGDRAGYTNTTGTNNTILGSYAGFRLVSGSGNVFLGRQAGYYETKSNKLYIDNTANRKPLIYGDFASNVVTINGKLGMGTAKFPIKMGTTDISKYKLFVKGGVLTEEVRVQKGGWADYVFNKEYKLRPLIEVERYIQKNGHLPNMPSAETVASNGLELGAIAILQQEKIEELTLYTILQQKELKEKETKLKELEAKFNSQEERLSKIEKLLKK